MREFQCSSASRKFLNQVVAPDPTRHWPPFQCSSASRKFLNPGSSTSIRWLTRFQCSSASRKFLNAAYSGLYRCGDFVSVLFSEPKIPQLSMPGVYWARTMCFSALQRAENSSIGTRAHSFRACLSGFSALQRAENSSILTCTRIAASSGCVSVLFSEPKIPQSHPPAACASRDHRFSALQRAENSSILRAIACDQEPEAVSVLFSEPKIPQ